MAKAQSGKGSVTGRTGERRSDEASFCPVSCSMEELDAKIATLRTRGTKHLWERKFLEGARYARVLIHVSAGEAP